MSNREKIEEPIRKVLNQIWEGEIYPQEAGDIIMQLIEPDYIGPDDLSRQIEVEERFFGQMKGAQDAD